LATPPKPPVTHRENSVLLRALYNTENNFALLALCAGPMLFVPSRKHRVIGAILVVVAFLGGAQQYVAGKALKARLEQLRR
jgi:hypothetical protein